MPEDFRRYKFPARVLLHEDVARKRRHTVAPVRVVAIGRDLQEAILAVRDQVVADDVIEDPVSVAAATPFDVRAPCAVDGRSLFTEPPRRIPHVVPFDEEILDPAGVIRLNVAQKILDGIHAMLDDVILEGNVLHIDLIAHGPADVIVVRLHGQPRVVDLVDIVVLAEEPVAGAVDLNGVAEPRLVVPARDRRRMGRTADPTEFAVGDRQPDLRVGSARSDPVYARIFDTEIIEGNIVRLDGDQVFILVELDGAETAAGTPRQKTWGV